MVTINVSNSKSKLIATVEEIHLLRKQFRIRAPGAWYSPAFRNRTWDGFVYYVTEAGYFQTGLLPKITAWMREQDWEFKINDPRIIKIPKKVYTVFDKVTLRGYQKEAVEAVIYNQVEGIYFQRGILDEATNAGKSLIAASLFKSFAKDKKLIFIVNRQHLYNQLKKEIAELIGFNEIGYIGHDGVKWNRFMICMAQTISKQYKSLGHQLSKFDIAVIDECHYGSSNTYKYIMQDLDNCTIRVGLSGSPLLHKDKNKNEKILSFFGPVLHKTTNDDLIRLGFSTKPIVTLSTGNTLIKINGDYKGEETKGLIKSKERNKKVLARIKLHINNKRFPLLLICKYHNHTELLYKKMVAHFPELRVNYIHVKVKDRLKRLEAFREGKIDIFVSSKLIKEGQNLPKIRALVLACGGDSVIDVLQLVGRSLRKDKSKKLVYIDDFMDEGFYLKRHSKHRKKVYKDQGFKIIDKTLNNK